MFEGEFTHEGDRCSFEVLLARSGISDPGLQAIAEIVHDIDLKDSKFKREEATGIARLIAGIAMANKDDEQRIAQGAPVFDNLYRSPHETRVMAGDSAMSGFRRHRAGANSPLRTLAVLGERRRTGVSIQRSEGIT